MARYPVAVRRQARHIAAQHGAYQAAKTLNVPYRTVAHWLRQGLSDSELSDRLVTTDPYQPDRLYTGAELLDRLWGTRRRVMQTVRDRSR